MLQFRTAIPQSGTPTVRQFAPRPQFRTAAVQFGTARTLSRTAAVEYLTVSAVVDAPVRECSAEPGRCRDRQVCGDAGAEEQPPPLRAPAAEAEQRLDAQERNRERSEAGKQQNACERAHPCQST